MSTNLAVNPINTHSRVQLKRIAQACAAVRSKVPNRSVQPKRNTKVRAPGALRRSTVPVHNDLFFNRCPEKFVDMIFRAVRRREYRSHSTKPVPYMKIDWLVDCTSVGIYVRRIQFLDSPEHAIAVHSLTEDTVRELAEAIQLRTDAAYVFKAERERLEKEEESKPLTEFEIEKDKLVKEFIANLKALKKSGQP